VIPGNRKSHLHHRTADSQQIHSTSLSVASFYSSSSSTALQSKLSVSRVAPIPMTIDGGPPRY
jgi:hypothetical protein